MLNAYFSFRERIRIQALQTKSMILFKRINGTKFEHKADNKNVMFRKTLVSEPQTGTECIPKMSDPKGHIFWNWIVLKSEKTYFFLTTRKIKKNWRKNWDKKVWKKIEECLWEIRFNFDEKFKNLNMRNVQKFFFKMKTIWWIFVKILINFF